MLIGNGMGVLVGMSVAVGVDDGTGVELGEGVGVGVMMEVAGMGDDGRFTVAEEVAARRGPLQPAMLREITNTNSRAIRNLKYLCVVNIP
jgi:hypothetical protein